MVDLATRRRIGIGLTALVVLATGACSTSQDPGGSPTSSKPVTRTSTPATTSATPSAPPTTEAPFDPVPEAARQHTNEGAIAFALFFIDQSNKVFMSPRPGVFARLCTPNSKFCASLESDIQYYARNGWRSDRPVGTVRGQQIVPRNEPSVTTVALDYNITDYNMIDSQGAVRKTSKAEPLPMQLLLLWDQSGWVVDAISTPTE